MVVWPKDLKFCGLCSVKIGVVFYIIIHLLSNGLSILFLWVTLANSIAGSVVTENNSTEYDNEEFNDRMRPVLWSFIAVLGFFITMECFFVGLLVYGLYKFNPLTVKIHLIYGVIMWIFGVMAGVATGLLFEVSISVIRIILSIFHGFMLLNMRTLYIKMIKKPQAVMILSPETTSTTALDVNNSRESSQGSASIVQHCGTCSCNQPLALRSQIPGRELLSPNAGIPADSLASRSFDLPVDEERVSNGCSKELNFKEEAIIYDEEQLERGRTYASSTHSSENECRLDVKEKNEIFYEQDVPVIYDENQLNVGRSPILNDRSFVQELPARSVQGNDQRERSPVNTTYAHPPKYQEAPNSSSYYVKEKNIIEEKDVPVIYDENQFIVGRNPILEDIVPYSVQETDIYLPNSSANFWKRIS